MGLSRVAKLALQRPLLGTGSSSINLATRRSHILHSGRVDGGILSAAVEIATDDMNLAQVSIAKAFECLSYTLAENERCFHN